MEAMLLAGSLGISALQGVQGYRQAKAQHKFDTKLYKQNVGLTKEALNESYADNLLRAMQEMVALRTTLEDQAREGLAQRGTAEVIAGEAGVMGQSVDMVIDDLRSQQGRAADRALLSHGNTMQTLGSERRNLRSQARATIAGMRQPGARPSGSSFLLASLGQMAGSAQTYHSAKRA